MFVSYSWMQYISLHYHDLCFIKKKKKKNVLLVSAGDFPLGCCIYIVVVHTSISNHNICLFYLLSGEPRTFLHTATSSFE